MIDHVTVEVMDLNDPDLPLFFSALDLLEVEPAEEIAETYNVRWWEDEDGKQIHLIQQDKPQVTFPGLGHFCIKGVGAENFDRLRESEWCTVDSGSGRIWLETASGAVRVEVHP